jgi:5-methyltetrahydropteroyltriglutamate--homocysteine methyltransferase
MRSSAPRRGPSPTSPAAVLTGPVGDADLTLVDEFRTVSTFARHEVKVTMTGPHMLARVAWDEYYHDIRRFMQELAKVINRNFKDLQAAGCKHVQIDEPLFAAVDRSEVEAAVDAINQAFEGISMTKWVHICQGNYAVGADYDGQIGHRYFDFGQYPADLICKIDCDALMIEGDMTPRYEGLLGNQQLAIGAADVQDMNVEKPETLVERLTAYRWLPRERTLITSSCGMNHLPRDIAFGKLKAMANAKKLLTGTPAREKVAVAA